MSSLTYNLLIFLQLYMPVMCDKEKSEVHYSDYLQEEPASVLTENLLILYPVLSRMGCMCEI